MKGTRFENEIAKALNGKRVPLSGALGYLDKALSEDVTAPTGERIQCKCLHNGWATLYKLLETADWVAVKADHKVPLMIIPLPMFQKIYLRQEGDNAD